jgi:spermidine dehydrogenase
LKSAYFFDKETFGTEKLVAGIPGPNSESKDWSDYLAKTPLSADAQRGIVRIQTERTDYMPGLSQAEKKDKLSRMSYRDFLLNVVKVSPDAAAIYQTRTHGLYGIGIDAVPALDCWAIHFPGFEGLGLDRVPGGRLSFTALGEVTPSQPYHFHFPDGNASIARLLVRSLIPASAPGHTPEDIVTAKIDYSQLDKKDLQVRIRLNSTAVKIQHVGDAASAKEVEVTYGRDSRAYTVRANSVVLACWNMVIPYICAELPAKQKQALKYGVKVPLVYTVVAIKNWTSFQKLGISRVSAPGMYHSSVGLDQSTNIGEYISPKTSGEPILVRMLRTPCQPGLSAREQQKIGRYDLLSTDFETFERNIRDQLARILSPGGFDPARDIDAITVNRWPHGYAYEYNPMWDLDWPVGQRPCDIARQRFGRIAIANSDAAAAAYTDQAIDQAFRAVRELQST